ncbi:YdeI family protein [Duncaniella freteri]|uniref:YdeI/OmpD-associated family protein n=1 Tax=Duncaniella freteri TaxID=2530391 RepID=UPI00258D1E90|nr:YdeI/OmpD-associated family protein [Duncaniella freteri]
MNILHITTRNDFRKWLSENHKKESECWLEAKRGKTPPAGALWYLDAVEEALCFGWIDSTVKNIDGVTLQRFSRRSRHSNWTELNKERCRRLESLGLMTDSGREVCPDFSAEFVVDSDIVAAFESNPVARANFSTFHPLYRRVRIDTIQRNKANQEIFYSRLEKLIDASERGEMFGDWNDNGRLLDY